MTWMSATTEARVVLGVTLNTALREAEQYMREAEAQHEKVKADPLFTEADRRASLTEVTLSHRALALLRPLAEMLPAHDEDAPMVLTTAHRVEHPPAPGWSRAPEEVMGNTIGSLARALYAMAGTSHFDVHVSDTGLFHVFVDRAKAAGFLQAMNAIFGDGPMPSMSKLPVPT